MRSAPPYRHAPACRPELLAAFALLCLFPLSCMVEQGTDGRGLALEFKVPDSLRHCDSLLVYLKDSAGFDLDTLWTGAMTGDSLLQKRVTRYGGGEAVLFIEGVCAEKPIAPQRVRINLSKGIMEPLLDPGPPPPSDPGPAEGARDMDTALTLAWTSGKDSVPGLKARIFLGTGIPPPLFKAAVKGRNLAVTGLLHDTIYYWRAVNILGSKEAAGSIWSFRTRVARPERLAYSADSLVCVTGVPAVPARPAWRGGPIRAFSIVPALPDGLALDSSTGVLSGNPIRAMAKTAFLITGRNESGEATASLAILIREPNHPPGIPASPSPADSAVVPDTNLVLAWEGGDGDGDSVSYRLRLRPDGGADLLDTLVGAPSLRVEGLRPATTYRWDVAASDGKLGSAGPAWTFRVLPRAIADFRYPVPSLACTVGAALPAQHPSWSGGKPERFTVEPGLPAGLILDERTGALSGTPVVPSGETLYSVQAANARGSATVKIGLVVILLPPRPESLAYSVSTVPYRTGKAIPANAPSWKGGDPDTFYVTPELPGGISLHPRTGVLSGTPKLPSSPTAYAVTAANRGGSAGFTLNLSVQGNRPPAAPVPLSPANGFAGSDTAAELAWEGGDADGDPVSYRVYLGTGEPLGLRGGPSDSTRLGIAELGYDSLYRWQVVASDGDTAVPGPIWTFRTKIRAPSQLAYPAGRAVFRAGRAIVPLRPTCQGGPVSRFRIQPALPSGLLLDSLSGELSGTPATAFPSAEFTVTASNAGGSAGTGLTLEAEANHAPDPAGQPFPGHEAIDQDTGTVLSWTGADPNGDTLTYILRLGTENPPGFRDTLRSATGRANGLLWETRYFWSIRTTDGFAASDGPVWSFRTRPAPPRSLPYPFREPAFPRGTPIQAGAPAYQGGGGAVYRVTPQLPEGLRLDSSTGEIKGVPARESDPAEYTVTASNFSGQASDRVVLRVDPPRMLVAHWNFEEADADRSVMDASGNGRDGSVKAESARTPGVKGKAMRFDGANRVDIPFDPSFNLKEFTLLCWVKSAGGYSWQSLLSRQPPEGRPFDYRLMLASPYSPPLVEGSAMISFWNPLPSPDTGWVAGNRSLIDEKWHLVAATFGKDRLRVYVDGALDAERHADERPAGMGSGPVTLGASAYAGGSYFLKGLLDEVRIYNYAWEASAVDSLFLAESPKPGIGVESLVGHWDFDDGQGETLLDRSGHGFHGSVQGGAEWKPGVKGGSLEFDGRDDHVRLPRDPAFQLRTFTFLAWVKTTDFDLGEWVVYSNLLSTDPGRNTAGVIFRFRDHILETVAARSPIGGGWHILSAQPEQDAGWHQVGLTFDTVRTGIWWDGVEIDSARFSGELELGETTPMLGACLDNWFSQGYFRGQMDEVSLYNRVLSAKEILAALRAVRP